jgi:hypothetical protein
VKIEEAKAIAAAPAMSDTMADIIETRGADTEDEYHSFEARMVTRVLGDAFTDADEDERTELVLRTKHDQLATKARTFAAVWMLLQDDPDLRRQLAAAEVARNRESTVIAEKLTIPEASAARTSRGGRRSSVLRPRDGVEDRRPLSADRGAVRRKDATERNQAPDPTSQRLVVDGGTSAPLRSRASRREALLPREE